MIEVLPSEFLQNKAPSSMALLRLAIRSSGGCKLSFLAFLFSFAGRGTAERARCTAKFRSSGFFMNRATMYNASERGLKGVIMEGIQFLTNDKGERVAVQIDLRKYGDLWEDVYDSLIARRRSAEPRESFDSVKERLIKQRKLNG